MTTEQFIIPQYYLFYPIGIFNIVLTQEFVKRWDGMEQIVWTDKQTVAKQCPQFEEGVESLSSNLENGLSTIKSEIKL